MDSGLQNNRFTIFQCPKCQGPLQTQQDHFGRYRRCSTCGLNIEPNQDPPNGQNPGKLNNYEIDLGTKHMQDRGCEVSRRCTECPLPECRFDNPRMYHRYLRARDNQEIILAVLQEKLTNAQAARRYDRGPREIGKLIQYHQETPAGEILPENHPGATR